MSVTLVPPCLERRIVFPLDVYSGLQVVTLDNPGWMRLVYWCSVTVNPGAAETVQLLLSAVVPGGTDFIAPGTAPSDLVGGPGVISLIVGPGVGAGWLAFGGNKITVFRDTMLAHRMSFSFAPSGAGDWTMEAGVDGWWA